MIVKGAYILGLEKRCAKRYTKRCAKRYTTEKPKEIPIIAKACIPVL